MRRTRRGTLVALVVGGLVVTAAPAGAHPFFTDGATVPASSLATVTLAMAHGCGTEQEGGGDPTLEVAVEVPEAVSFIEPAEVDGYEVTTEGDPGAVPDVVVWTATGDGEPAPELTMDLVVDGAEGDEVFVSVFQGCADFEYRWVGTPDAPADDPAVQLTLAATDPDSPPPAGDPDGEVDDGEVGEDPADPDATDEPTEEPTAVEDLPTEAPAGAEDGAGFPVVPVVLGAIVLVALGALVAGRRTPTEPEAQDPASSDPPPTA